MMRNELLYISGGVLLGIAAKEFWPVLQKLCFPRSLLAPLPKPKLLVYELCPFCTRVRLILGLKAVEYDLVFVEYSDEVLPKSLIGQKMLPIFVSPDGSAMGESLDIVRYVDQNFNGVPVLEESAKNPKLEAWMQEFFTSVLKLVMPRNYFSNFPELSRAESRTYYRTKHEKRFGGFEDLMKESPALIQDVEKSLIELDRMMHSDKSVNAHLSYDDIVLYGILRHITIIKGLTIPAKVRRYIDILSEKSDIRTFDAIKL